MKFLYRDNFILVLLVGLVIVRGLIYMALVPPWLAPDEATHFEAIRLLGQEGLPLTQQVYQVTPMHPQMHPSFETFHIWQIVALGTPSGYFNVTDPSKDPYLYYYPRHQGGSVILAENYPLIYHRLLAPVSGWLKPLDITAQLYILRSFSLVLTTLTIVISWFFARTIFPQQKSYAVAVSSFLVFLPMHLHINTAVNTDTPVTLLVSLYFFMLAKIFCQGFSIKRIILASSILIIAVLVKPTALFAIPTAGVAGLIYLARRQGWRFWRLILSLGGSITLVFLGAIFIFQNGQGGRSLAILTLPAMILPALGDNYLSVTALTNYLYLARWSFLSFWGLFGWAVIPIPPGWITILRYVCLGTGGGIILFLAENFFHFNFFQKDWLNNRQKDILLVLLLSLIFAVISIYVPNITTQSTKEWAPQSRYLFPALLPLALYLFLGFQRIFPGKNPHPALTVWLASLILFDSLVISQVLIPFLYG